MGLVSKVIKGLKEKIVAAVLEKVVAKLTSLMYSITDLILAQVNGMVALIPTNNKFVPTVTTGATDRWADAVVDVDSLPGEAHIEEADVQGSKDYDFMYIAEDEIPQYDPARLPIITCMYCNEDQAYIDENRIIAKRVLKQQNETREKISKAIGGTKDKDAAINKATQDILADANTCWVKLKSHFTKIIDTAKAQIKAFDPLQGLDELPGAFGDIGKSLPQAFTAIAGAATMVPDFVIRTTKLISNATSETATLASNPYTSSAAPGYAVERISDIMQFMQKAQEEKLALEKDLDEAMIPIDSAIKSLEKLDKILYENPAAAILGQMPGFPLDTGTINGLSGTLRDLIKVFDEGIKSPIITAMNSVMLPIGGYQSQLESMLPSELKEKIAATQGAPNKYQNDATTAMQEAEQQRKDSVQAAIDKVNSDLEEQVQKMDECNARIAEINAYLDRGWDTEVSGVLGFNFLTPAQIDAYKAEINIIETVKKPPIQKKIDELNAELNKLKEDMNKDVEAETTDFEVNF